RNIPQTKKNMLSGPTGLTLDKDGNIWVTNCMNNSITVFDSKGKFLKNIPTTDENKLQYPIGLTTDKEGNIWVANHRDNSITVFDTRGNFLKNIPKTDKNKLDLPCGLTTDKEGNIWVTNIGNNSITVFDSNGIFIGNIPKTDKNKLNTPSGLTTDKEGNIWVANTADNSLSVFHGSRLKSPADIPSLQSEKQAAEQRIAALKAKLEELQARIKPGEPSEEPDVGFDTNRLRPVFSHVFGVQSADTLKHNQMLEKQKELARTAYLELTESAPDVIGDYAAYFEKLFESVGISFPKPEHGFVVSTGEQNRAA
ncbi:MAG: hypothetical protein JW774_02980, partial [Candidatus Aureabacteria bacterium]|nr:hypothetical protein [Candidatus Auribacterota bacterium]